MQQRMVWPMASRAVVFGGAGAPAGMKSSSTTVPQLLTILRLGQAARRPRGLCLPPAVQDEQVKRTVLDELAPIALLHAYMCVACQ